MPRLNAMDRSTLSKEGFQMHENCASKKGACKSRLQKTCRFSMAVRSSVTESSRKPKVLASGGGYAPRLNSLSAASGFSDFVCAAACSQASILAGNGPGCDNRSPAKLSLAGTQKGLLPHRCSPHSGQLSLCQHASLTSEQAKTLIH